MLQTLLIIAVIIAFLVLMLSFFAVFAMILKYLWSVYKLTVHIRDHDSELWERLDRPTMLPMMHGSANMMKAMGAKMKLLGWLLGSEPGEMQEITKKMRTETRKWFKFGVGGLLALFVLYPTLIVVLSSIVFAA